MSVRATLFSAALAVTGAADLAAQAIRGTVVDANNRPVVGAVVLLLDSAQSTNARALSNERGEFQLAAPRPATYRLRTLRIGFRPTTSDPIVAGNAGDVTTRLVLTGLPLVLDAVRVSSTGCRMDAASCAAVFEIWDQIRTALIAAQLTAAQRTIVATNVKNTRLLDARGRRVIQQSSVVGTGAVNQPWHSLPPDSIRKVGYFTVGEDSARTYHLPDLDILLSDEFLEDHSFRLTKASDAARIGIAFQPGPERKDIPEIEGTLWVDKASVELRRLDLQFVNVPGVPADRSAQMDFARMRDGTWAISRWSARIPVVARVDMGRLEQLHVVAVKVDGGELALARRGTDTLWMQAPLVLQGTVIDSVTGAAVPDAVVVLEGTPLGAYTDFSGSFGIAGVLPGQYSVQVHTPTLDSLSLAHRLDVAVVDSAQPIWIRVPPAEHIVAALCEGAEADSLARGIIVGRVKAPVPPAPPVPLKNLRVVADWTVDSMPSVGKAAQNRRSREAEVDSRGTFHVCGVPVSAPVVLHALADSTSSGPVAVTWMPAAGFAHADLEVGATAASFAAFSGRVVIDSTRQPLAGAEVSLPNLGKTTLTDDRGAFHLTEIPAGDHRVSVRHVGFGPLDTTISFRASQTFDRQVVLSRVAALSTVVTTAKALIPSFEENRKIGLGHFFTRDDLAKRENQTLAVVLSELPGLQLVRARNGASQFAMSRRITSMSSGMCYDRVYVDDAPAYSGRRGEPPFDLSAFQVEEVEAIEFYRGPSETPLKYSGLGSQCGVLVIWTHKPPPAP